MSVLYTRFSVKNVQLRVYEDIPSLGFARHEEEIGPVSHVTQPPCRRLLRLRSMPPSTLLLVQLIPENFSSVS